MAKAIHIWTKLRSQLKDSAVSGAVEDRAAQLFDYAPALLAYVLDPSLFDKSPLPSMYLMQARQYLFSYEDTITDNFHKRKKIC